MMHLSNGSSPYQDIWAPRRRGVAIDRGPDNLLPVAGHLIEGRITINNKAMEKDIFVLSMQKIAQEGKQLSKITLTYAVVESQASSRN